MAKKDRVYDFLDKDQKKIYKDVLKAKKTKFEETAFYEKEKAQVVYQAECINVGICPTCGDDLIEIVEGSEVRLECDKCDFVYYPMDGPIVLQKGKKKDKK